jgi:hypothetical protein
LGVAIYTAAFVPSWQPSGMRHACNFIREIGFPGKQSTGLGNRYDVCRSFTADWGTIVSNRNSLRFEGPDGTLN